jgi:uncharacterized membrane protein
MTAVTFLTIRAAHVLVAALWIGSTVFMATLLMPAVEATGAAGGQLMARLQRRGFPIYMEAIGVTTVLSGLYLLWHFTGGFDPSVSTSHAGLAFGVGGAAGVLAGVIGGAVVGRSAKKLTRLTGNAMTIADDDVHRSLLAEIASLKRRMRSGTRVVVGLQTVALVFMSVGHYV